MKRYIFSFILMMCIGFANASELTMATFNLRNDNKSDDEKGNGWAIRGNYCADMIRFHGFDIFGTQELKKNQIQDMLMRLPGYDYIGVARDDGKEKGEYSAIFYDTEKIEVLDQGNFWLAEDTTYPHLGWDAVCIRICTWGKFKIKKNGFTFLYYNLHMDHRGVKARAESAKLILKKIKELPEKIPFILSGDFNVDQTSESYLLLNNSGVVKDAYELAEFRYAPNGTFNGFKTDRFADKRIDHIFLTNEFKVKKYGILTDTYRSERTSEETKEIAKEFPKEVNLYKNIARTPSDHFPVVLKLEIPD